MKCSVREEKALGEMNINYYSSKRLNQDLFLE